VALAGLFPTVGFQIITEPRSLEDSPCPEIRQSSLSGATLRSFAAYCKRYFGRGHLPLAWRTVFESKRPVPDWIEVIILGIIEGVTEFLPVSSTGHLLIAEHWLGKQSDLFNTVIQCGAVLAVVVIFTGRLKQLLFHLHDTAPRDYLLKLGVAFFLTGVGGVILKKLDFELPTTAAPVAWATLIGGILFLVVERGLRGKSVGDQVTWTVAIAVGLGQLLAAVFPGASRSGMTILVALMLGLSRPAATEFSFLLGIPTLLSAGALQIFSA